MRSETLKSLEAFVVWKSMPDKSGRMTKVPHSPTDDFQIGTTEEYRSRWGSYKQAIATRDWNKKGFDGIGIVFTKLTETLSICGIDIDNSNPEGEFVKGIIAIFPNGLIERSPSDNGIHILILVDVSRIPQKMKNGKPTLDPKYYSKNPGNGVEAYIATLTNRYFTVTEDIIQDGADVDQTDEFLRFLDLYMLRHRDAEPSVAHGAGREQSITDEAILQKARSAANGAKFISLFDRGDISGYESQSSADLSLMNILAFYTRCDKAQMERLFSQSALGQRGKWKERDDYRNMTIERAAASCRQVYEPSNRATTQVGHSDWREPTPLDTIIPPDFPLECFPQTLSDYVKELSEYTQTDPAMAGVSCLGILGGVFQNKISVQSVNGNIEQTSIYAVKICAPAERKSEVDRYTTRPIIKFSNRYNAAHKADITRSRAEYKMKQKALTAAEKAKETDFDALLLAQNDIDNFKEVALFTLIADDTTIEALITLMTQNNERMLIASDEGGIFSHMKGRYKINGDDIELYLKAHSGGRVSVHRKSREPETLENPALSLCVSVQPYIAENAILDDENTGRGLTARLVFAYCDEKAGTRGAVSKPMSDEVVKRYEKAIIRCLEQTIHDDISLKSDYSTVRIAKLSEDAREYAIGYFDVCERRIIDGLERAKGWNGKCFGLAIRIAGLFHSFECMERDVDPADLPIPLSIMMKAAKLVEVLAIHAEKVFMGTDRKNTQALYLLKRLLGLLGTSLEINKQDVWQKVKRRFEGAEAFDETLKALETNEYIRIEQQKTKGRPLTVIRQIRYAMTFRGF